MAANKKLISAVAAVTTSAALLLGGTLAWQSTNQTALNEASDIVNPGGRLHDDFDGSNKDVYVENFAEEDIFARIRLEEYFEIVQNRGTGGEKVHNLIGSKTETTDDQGNTVYEYEYVIHDFTTEDNVSEDGAVDEEGKAWWNWTLGGQTTFMPTFNKNKDSLAADVNGVYRDTLGGFSDRDGTQYQDTYVDYTDAANASKTANEIYDYDSNTLDELTAGGADIKDIIDNGNLDAAYADAVTLINATHNTAETANAQLISMADWMQLLADNGDVYDPDTMGNYWVYDTDGWVYWSAPIPAGEATGLLLNGIELAEVMDDSWYYAINVVAQFITADDAGKAEGTGFYNTDEGIVPSAEAEELLKAIGVQIDDTLETLELILDFDFTDTVYPEIGQPIRLIFDEDSIPEPEEGEEEWVADTSSVVLFYHPTDEEEVYLDDTQFSFDGDILIITDESLDGYTLYVRDASGLTGMGTLGGTIDLGGGSGDDDYESEGVITINGQGDDDEDGYIYITGLDIEQVNSFDVLVYSDYGTLKENGLTAAFKHPAVTDNTFTVDENDPYAAVLTIASHSYESVTITAEFDNDEVATVTLVPVFETIVIEPGMDGETISVPSGYYTLKADGFTDNAAAVFTLDGANRCMITEDNGTDKLSVASSESSENITITVTDGTYTAVVDLKVINANPDDSPWFSYYVVGGSTAYANALIQTQEYSWVQSDSYIYRVSASVVNSFEGTINWSLEDAVDGAVNFVDEDGNNPSATAAGREAYVKFTADQNKPFRILVDISGTYNNGDYNYRSDEMYFIINPVKNGYPRVQYLNVHDIDYTPYVVYLAPGASANYEFDADVRDGGEVTNADMTWSLTEAEAGCTFSVEEHTGEGSCTATVTHTCAEDTCTKVGAVQVTVTYDHSYGVKKVSDQYVAAVGYAGSLDLGSSDDYEEEFDSGNVVLNYTISDGAESLNAGETITFAIDGYDDLSAFTWEIVDCVGVYAVDGQPGVFTHYDVGTDEYNECACTLIIKATLNDDPEVWGAVKLDCA